MKALKIWLILMAAALAVFAFNGAALAFHDGGVAYCEGCHTMHNSVGGAVVNTPGGVKGTVGNGLNEYLLQGSDPSSTCLNCHAKNTMGANIQVLSSDGTAYTPGGDFYWVNKTYTYSPWAGANMTSEGYNHGHSVIASDFGLSEDSHFAGNVGPGGTYPASNLACNSCHNPHGRVNGGTRNSEGPVKASGSYGPGFCTPDASGICGNYRLLADGLYNAGDPAVFGSSSAQGFPVQGYHYTANAPVAVAPQDFREKEDGYGTGSGIEHVDYGTGIAEWCANCHGAFLNNSGGTGTGYHRHPAGDSAKLGGLASLYNSYVKSGDYAGDSSKSYLPLVPFERGVATGLVANSPAGPDGANAAVMCLSCHRAHASAFDEMTRWDTSAEFMSASSALIATSKPWAANAPYYGWDIVGQMGSYQRNLCNKCHVQD